MKKLLLIAVASLSGLGAFAQSATLNTHTFTSTKQAETKVNRIASSSYYDDSLVLSGGLSLADTEYYYSVGTANDSGYFLGMNAYGLNGFAQRYDFNGADSTVEVLGVLSIFSGTANPVSTNHVVFKAWSLAGPGAADPFSSTVIYSGLPGTLLDSVIAPVTSLSISATGTNYNVQFFATPTSYLSSSFFVGYTMNYTWGATNGDTITLMTSDFRTQNLVDSVVGGDSVINDQNAFSFPGEGWFDADYDGGLITEYFLFPIVNTDVSTLSVKGITKNGFTFYGNYPNPAADNTNIKFSLANNSDVTITIMDMAGHTINTINETNLSAGMNIIPVSTSSLSAGDYLVLVRTASGDGIASKLTVIK